MCSTHEAKVVCGTHYSRAVCRRGEGYDGTVSVESIGEAQKLNGSADSIGGCRKNGSLIPGLGCHCPSHDFDKQVGDVSKTQQGEVAPLFTAVHLRRCWIARGTSGPNAKHLLTVGTPARRPGAVAAERSIGPEANRIVGSSQQWSGSVTKWGRAGRGRAGLSF